MFSVPVMLTVTVLFAPTLLGLLLFASVLEYRILRRPELDALRAAEAAQAQKSAPVIQVEEPAPIPAHLPSPVAATETLLPTPEPVAQPAD